MHAAVMTINQGKTDEICALSDVRLLACALEDQPR
jgi:hypothetical protein